MYRLIDNKYTYENNITGKDIIKDDTCIGFIAYNIKGNIMEILDISIFQKYQHKHNATELLKQLANEFNIDIIEGMGTCDDGEFYWENLGAEMSEYQYSDEIIGENENGSPQYYCLGRNFKLTKEALFAYAN